MFYGLMISCVCGLAANLILASYLKQPKNQINNLFDTHIKKTNNICNINKINKNISNVGEEFVIFSIMYATYQFLHAILLLFKYIRKSAPLCFILWFINIVIFDISWIICLCDTIFSKINDDVSSSENLKCIILVEHIQLRNIIIGYMILFIFSSLFTNFLLFQNY